MGLCRTDARRPEAAGSSAAQHGRVGPGPGAMKPCPYRAEHEFDADGLCVHCFTRYSVPLPDPMPDVSEGAVLYCSVAGCGEPATLVRVNQFKWSTRCQQHQEK